MMKLDIAIWRLKVLASPLACDLKSKDLWLIRINLRREYNCGFQVLQKVMRERGTEVSSIDVYLLEFGNIDLLTFWAEHFES